MGLWEKRMAQSGCCGHAWWVARFVIACSLLSPHCARHSTSAFPKQMLGTGNGR